MCVYVYVRILYKIYIYVCAVWCTDKYTCPFNIYYRITVYVLSEIRGFHVRGTYTHPENFLEATLSKRIAISFCPQTTHAYIYVYVTVYIYTYKYNISKVIYMYKFVGVTTYISVLGFSEKLMR